MNVTNRRKSGDAETPPTTHHHSQNQPLLSYISCRQAATVSNRNNRRQEEDQEQVVTSTSTDCVLPLQAEGEGEEVAIELGALVTSPARITSSTHNYDIVTNSVDSLSLDEMVMPSTSDNAKLKTEESLIKLIHPVNNNNIRPTNSSNDMVARDINLKTVADARGGREGGAEGGISLRDLADQSTSTSNNIDDTPPLSENHKIILKLPKSAASESQTMSVNEDDFRKVEPLKINLHNTHHYYHHHSTNTHHTPKITIKPILKETTTDALASSEECSSSAEDEMVSKFNDSEPHIIPKLTIRAKNEDYGSAHTTVVPKLTIKINDSSTVESLNTPSAANTPPLPKLTIKTGQDGHSESIITNISPASSTTSSSSLASSSATSSSSANYLVATPSLSIPKLTIKPLQKTHDSKSGQHTDQPPSIPKLCIKTNILCVDAIEETIASKIPKLTIKTGQEHAVIITQHSDHAKASGIPRLTIKTKSFDISDESNVFDGAVVEKIPKLTIKTNTTNEISKLCRSKAQLEVANAASITPLLSPKQQSVPKLTISRQPNQTERVLDAGDGSILHSIPKMTIKTQNKPECVPKVTLKALAIRPSSTEESGISDDPEDEVGEQILKSSKIIPKLTIRNVGSPKQKLKIVMDTEMEMNKISNPLPPISNELTLNEDVDEFNDLLNVDNVCGESSNSQEFCGFNENAADCPPNKQMLVVTSITTNAKDMELRRQSDDMDIDETLQLQHEPQIFQNIAHFNQPATTSSSSSQEPELNGKVALDVYSKMGHVIDTVDLTSSAGSSPAHRFDYNDDDEEEDTTIADQTLVDGNELVPTTNILLECLQREATVIQNSPPMKLQNEINSTPPPLHPKPISNKSPSSLKYPQLAERLMANGSEVGRTNTTVQSGSIDTGENIIDSIEILDTPEGSPRNSIDERPENTNAIKDISSLPNGLHYSKEPHLLSLNNNNLNLKRHSSLTNMDIDSKAMTPKDTNMEELPPKLRKLQNETLVSTGDGHNECHQMKVFNNFMEDSQNTKTEMNHLKQSSTSQLTLPSHQRSRKQKHEHLLPLPMDELMNCMQTTSNDSVDFQADNSNDTNENVTPLVKRRGRPKKLEVLVNEPSQNSKEETSTHTPVIDNKQDYKSRRVQLLRKRLAIDMVDADQPLAVQNDVESDVGLEERKTDDENADTTKRERILRTPLRTSRRSNTPISLPMESKSMKSKPVSSLVLENKKSGKEDASENVLNHFIESNSSISSASSHSSSTLTSTMVGCMSNNISISVSTQIDLTMSSSSSNSNGSTTNTITTVEATTSQGCVMTSNPDACGNGANLVGTSNNSMLPPTTILSSSDPLRDVVFRPNDFSSIIATQQLRSGVDQKSALCELQDEEVLDDASGAENSEDDSASSSSTSATPGRGRSRGRGGRSGRSLSRGHRSHRLGRGASAVAKAIALNRPRCVGALKHTPDPERIKGLYSPSPQVFEEDTRMSADLTQTILQQEPTSMFVSQPDFFTNEESQSSVISNNSILDPNNIIVAQNGSAVKKPIKKKKMEVCVSEDADFTVASIAEYDWPPPKGCCPSKNRDTFMIQEQVAMYLGIKSFKRKYPDLPRRQVDMEERNWLQEKGLVSEKMCDLGITAVWASDILDIMYTDFYHKYEEYKDFVRQKHLREIEAKQKSLGLNVAGRGLQARERAMLSTSKWNSYFNRTRKNERLSYLDLQTLIVNKPCPSVAPISTVMHRPVADAVALAVKAERIIQPPTLLQPRVCEPLRPRDIYYPLSLVPGQFCEKYYNYSTQELRNFPLNTMLDHSFQLRQYQQDGNNSSDTDSAVESIDNKTDVDKSYMPSASKCHSKRRIRRTRRIGGNVNNDEFKIPPVPGALMLATSSTDTCSSSDESSSETDSESTSCFSSSSEELSDDENTPATCGVCLRPHNRNLNDVPELFIQCYTCRRKVHPSCIEMPHRMAIRVRNYNWQCADCKCCIKCKRKQDKTKMLFCEQCDRGFHIYCLGIKAVPDGRWSCDRCSICMRCGATKPEGLPLGQQQIINSPNGERIKQVKHKKVKWINEYRLDHVTKLREHCSMLCVPCGRMKSTKRVQLATHNNTIATFSMSPGSSNDLSPSGSSSYSLSSSNSQQNLQSSLTATSSPNVNITQIGSAKEHIRTSVPTVTDIPCLSESKDSGTFTSRSSSTSITPTPNTSDGPPVVA